MDNIFFTNGEFIMLLTKWYTPSRCYGNRLYIYHFSILNHVTKDSQENPTKESLAIEKKLMSEYKVHKLIFGFFYNFNQLQLVIQKFVMEESSLQMSVVYATQVYCHELGFPKGTDANII